MPADHPQGTCWYHSHALSTMFADPAKHCMDMVGAFPDVENQISAGLSGAMIVGDDRTLSPESLRAITADTFVFKDSQIDHAGRIVQHNINSNDPTVWLVNGQLHPVLRVRPGETQLWRLVTPGPTSFYRLRLDRLQFTIVGQDGRPVVQADKVTTCSYRRASAPTSSSPRQPPPPLLRSAQCRTATDRKVIVTPTCAAFTST